MPSAKSGNTHGKNKNQTASERAFLTDQLNQKPLHGVKCAACNQAIQTLGDRQVVKDGSRGCMVSYHRNCFKL